MARYLVFEKKEKYNEWLVKNKKGDMLGDIAWHKKWSKFAFYPDQMCFEHEIYLCEMCLREIADFLKVENLKR